MNAVDILSKLGERPLKEYTWGELLANHINATVGDALVTVETSGNEAKQVLDKMTPDKQLLLYKMSFPPMSEEGNVADTGESSVEEKENPSEPTRPQRTYLTVVGVSTAFILAAVLVISVGVTMVTTGEYPDLKIFEAFMKTVVDMLTFVATSG